MLSNTTAGFDERCEWNAKVIRLLNSTIPVVWLAVGTFTNLFSIFIFNQRSMRHNSTFFYLSLMSIVDLVVIWFSSFRDFLAYRLEAFVSGPALCRFHVFVFFWACQTSSWLLVAANFDRLVFVTLFGFSKTFCTRRNAYKIAAFIFVVLAVFNSHFLFMVESDDTEHRVTINPFSYPKCYPKTGTYERFYTTYYGWMDAFVFSFIPCLIMIVCNVILLYKVAESKRNLIKSARKSLGMLEQARNESSEKATESVELDPLRGCRAKSVEQTSDSKLSSNRLIIPNPESLERMKSMAILIIGVTFLFIIFTMPINIYVPIIHLSHASQTVKRKCDDLIFCILNNMVNGNHSTSFFIYSGTNSKFQAELKSLFGRLSAKLTRKFNFIICGCDLNLSDYLNGQAIKKAQADNLAYPLVEPSPKTVQNCQNTAKL
nr:G protein-coupled receptor [Proales similis]